MKALARMTKAFHEIGIGMADYENERAPLDADDIEDALSFLEEFILMKRHIII